MDEFKSGQKIKTAGGGELEIMEKLGEGGQGIVYQVQYAGKALALKWYFPKKLHDPDTFYRNIEKNIKQGPPNATFLWPLEVTEFYEGSFGYLMDLRPSEYRDFSLFLLAKEHFSSISAVIHAALCITGGFRALHNRGYSHQDLNDGNFFVNPQTGDVLICDNDNVVPYGKNLGIAGKCRYMAPEVVTGRKLPDSHTDRFSLAVVLYMLLFLNHPLEGKRTMVPCLTEELERRFYGEEPIFVWDTENDSNRPVRGVHANELKLWPLYPEFVRNTFERAFRHESMVGADATHRILEKEWQEVFTRLRDLIVPCSCGGETFLDPSIPDNPCVNCGRPMRRPIMMRVKKYDVALTRGKKFFPCHTQYDSDDFRNETGEVVTSRYDATILGLRNDSDAVWEAILPNGLHKGYGTGQIIRLGRGMKINFGNGNVAELY